MKVLMLIDDLGVGGAQTHLVVLARRLRALGCEVVVASSGGELADRLVGADVKLLYLPKVAEGGLGFVGILRARRLIARYVKEICPDVVHSHTRRMAFLAQGVCRACGVEHIFTAHAKFVMDFPKNVLTRYGDGVIAVSEDIKNHLFSQPRVAKLPLRVIENGVEFKGEVVESCATRGDFMGNNATCDHFSGEKVGDHYHKMGERYNIVGKCAQNEASSFNCVEIQPAGAEIGGNLGINLTTATRSTVDGGRKTTATRRAVEGGCKTTATHRAVDGGVRRIVFVSRLDADCSLGAYLLCEISPRIVERFAEVEVIIVGGGSEYASIKAKAEKINVKINQRLINAVGWVEDPSIFYENADVFVGVSRAALEAMARAVPVILLGDEGYLGILNEKTVEGARRTNLTCRGSESARAEDLLSDVCRILGADFEERERLGTFGYELVRRYYSAESMARRTLDFYREVRGRF